jgi:hypothetical protein
MAKATSYNVVGNREDLTDILSVVVPEETPVTSMIAKGRGPKAVYHEWQVDTLEAPEFAGVAEGEDVSDFNNKGEYRERLGNYIQKFRRAWAVSDIQESVDTAGVPSEKARSKAKCLQEIKRDIESAICSDGDRAAGPIHKLRGLGDWIDSAGPADVGAAYRTPSGSINATAMASLTEALFNGVLQSVYEQHGSRKSLTLVAGPALKKAVTGFTRAEGATTAKAYQVHEQAGSKKITFDVSIYDGPFNVIAIVPSLFNGRTSGGALTDTVRCRGYLLDPSLLSIGYMKQPGAQELENQGGGPRGYVDAILTLCVKNPLGLGKFNATALS